MREERQVSSGNGYYPSTQNRTLSVVVFPLEEDLTMEEMEIPAAGNEVNLKQLVTQDSFVYKQFYEPHCPMLHPGFSVYRKPLQRPGDAGYDVNLHIILFKCETYKFPRNPNAYILEQYCGTNFYGPLVVACNFSTPPHRLTAFTKRYLRYIVDLNHKQYRLYPPPHNMACSGNLDQYRRVLKPCDFFMYRYKTAWCPYTQNNINHEWTRCIYAHRPHDFRRAPDQYEYMPEDCPRGEKCEFGINCRSAHSKLEKMYHPMRYKTNPCDQTFKEKVKCKRGDTCSFYHNYEEIRSRESLVSLVKLTDPITDNPAAIKRNLGYDACGTNAVATTEFNKTYLLDSEAGNSGKTSATLLATRGQGKQSYTEKHPLTSSEISVVPGVTPETKEQLAQKIAESLTEGSCDPSKLDDASTFHPSRDMVASHPQQGHHGSRGVHHHQHGGYQSQQGGGRNQRFNNIGGNRYQQNSRNFGNRNNNRGNNQKRNHGLRGNVSNMNNPQRGNGDDRHIQGRLPYENQMYSRGHSGMNPSMSQGQYLMAGYNPMGDQMADGSSISGNQAMYYQDAYMMANSGMQGQAMRGTHDEMMRQYEGYDRSLMTMDYGAQQAAMDRQAKYKSEMQGNFGSISNPAYESRVISIDPKIEAFLTSLKLGDLVPYFQGLHFEQFSVLSKEDMLNGGIPMGVTLKVCQALHFLHSRQASQRMEEYVKTPPGLDVSSSRTSASPKEILGEEAFSSFQDASSRAIGRREGSSAGASANASANSSMIAKKPLQEMNTTSSSTPSSSGNTTERKEENKGNFSFNFEGMISFLDEQMQASPFLDS